MVDKPQPSYNWLNPKHENRMTAKTIVNHSMYKLFCVCATPPLTRERRAKATFRIAPGRPGKSLRHKKSGLMGRVAAPVPTLATKYSTWNSESRITNHITGLNGFCSRALSTLFLTFSLIIPPSSGPFPYVSLQVSSHPSTSWGLKVG